MLLSETYRLTEPSSSLRTADVLTRVINNKLALRCCATAQSAAPTAAAESPTTWWIVILTSKPRLRSLGATFSAMNNSACASCSSTRGSVLPSQKPSLQRCFFLHYGHQMMPATSIIHHNQGTLTSLWAVACWASHAIGAVSRP